LVRETYEKRFKKFDANITYGAFVNKRGIELEGSWHLIMPNVVQEKLYEKGRCMRVARHINHYNRD